MSKEKKKDDSVSMWPKFWLVVRGIALFFVLNELHEADLPFLMLFCCIMFLMIEAMAYFISQMIKKVIYLASIIETMKDAADNSMGAIDEVIAELKKNG